MVELFLSGKSQADIAREYDLTAAALRSWIKRLKDTGSFDNRSPERQELIELRKRNKQLEMENDISWR